MSEPRALLLSDLHLERADDARFITLRHILKANADAQIFILGDLTEVWVGDDDDAPLAQALGTLLKELSQVTTVYLMHGNRDFLFGAEFAAQTGVRLLADPASPLPNLLLAHGDAYCTDDLEYQNLRKMFRSSEWQRSILEQTLDARRALAAGMRAQSKATNANKAQNIMDVNVDAIEAALAPADVSLLIHGHTHRPGSHQHRNGARLVLGDWDHCAWVAIYRASTGANLWRLPLTDRCETESQYRLP